MCNTRLAAHQCLGFGRGEHGWGVTGLCMVTSPARGTLEEMGVICFGNPDSITAKWTVHCLMI